MMNSSRWSNKWTYSTSCTCAENESAEYICSVLMYSKVISVLAGNIAKLKLRHLRNVQGLLEWKWYAWSTQLLAIQIVIRSVFLLRVKRSRWNCELLKQTKNHTTIELLLLEYILTVSVLFLSWIVDFSILKLEFRQVLLNFHLHLLIEL